MADEFQEKTEQATPRKKQKAREKGQVARSKDLTSTITMGGIIMIFYFGGQHFFMSLAGVTGGMLSLKYGTDPMQVSKIAILQGVKIVIPFFIVSVVMALLASVMQDGIVLKPLKFEIEKLNPIQGMGRIFSSKGLIELLKSMLKFSVGGWLVYYIINKDLKILPRLTAMEMNEMVKVSTKLIMDAIIIAFAYYMVVAIIGYFIDKWQYEKSLRMSKQELKEESKESEGDPIVKSRIKSAQRAAARKRMMQEVPTATVVITNPTHLAVAVRYEDGVMPAPRIVAKGAGIVAEKIKEIARENGVPIIEDKPIARALFKLELNEFIPEGLYVAVAKILAYIYKLKGKL
ncbi:MAG: flagellar biosynthesis protein FlhB [Nitrospirota bacterium]